MDRSRRNAHGAPHRKVSGEPVADGPLHPQLDTRPQMALGDRVDPSVDTAAGVGRGDPGIDRGVALDLRSQYPLGRTVTWWGVSSCTSEPGVARAFLGSRGKRTLFEVTPVRAVGIRAFSAFTGGEEYILPPGTQLKVTGVTTARGGLSTVRLTELEEQTLVS